MPVSPRGDVAGVEAEDVLVAQEDAAVDVRLAGPTRLVATREDLHGHTLATMHPSPHLAVATLAWRNTKKPRNQEVKHDDSKTVEAPNRGAGLYPPPRISL